MKDDINALDEIHKGTCMGIDAIDFVIDKVEDKNLKKDLERFYDNYQDIAKIIEDIYPNYNDGEPHSTSVMNKAMTFSAIEMKTLTDTSNSKIAELLIKGVDMGIIEGRKILNNKKLNNEVRDIVKNYVTMQEESLDILKSYL